MKRAIKAVSVLLVCATLSTLLATIPSFAFPINNQVGVEYLAQGIDAVPLTDAELNQVEGAFWWAVVTFFTSAAVRQTAYWVAKKVVTQIIVSRVLPAKPAW